MPIAGDIVHDVVNAHSTHGRGPAFLVLLAFLLSFGFIRTSARLMRSPKVSWWPGSVTTESGLHLHHLVWGISLLLLSGFVAFATDLDRPWTQITAITFGIGAGLTLDEFALWVHLKDVYWSEQGRSSVDAVILSAAFAALVVLGVRPFGLDEFSSVAGTVAVTTICVLLATVTFLKGRILLGVVAIFIPLVGAVSAVRLAKPTSAWARRRYTGPRASRLRRAQERFSADRRSEALGRRILDLLGGTPSRP
ncbi:MAG: hypothetical protein E6G00_04360 [Actinobacteria bacterium]|nr:MAG: hypothetical protein E6G00_04360 [Actinomycetota bacterium]